MESHSDEISGLLEQLNLGNREVESRFMNLVYAELHRLAEACLRRNPDQVSIQASELVNEAYLKLVGEHHRTFENRGHFLGVAAHAMRFIMVDRIRAKRSEKRGGERVRVELDEPLLVTEDRWEEVLALDEALGRLEKMDARQAKLVELKFFGGLTTEEIAAVSGVPGRTVERELQHARRWLFLEMTRGGEHGSSDLETG